MTKMTTRNGLLTRKALAEAVTDVECSVLGNLFGDATLEGYKDNAIVSATDWVNERKLGDDGKVAQIITAVLKHAGFS